MIGPLLQWNDAPAPEALAAVLPCNGSQAWATQLVQRRPFPSPEALFIAADTIWWQLDPSAWQEAFRSHPRLGESHADAATPTSLTWSAGEQSGIAQAQDTMLALAAANRRYEDRFGRIFLVCASGKTTGDILAILERRLGNDPATELREAAEQQRRITQLRLRKWLDLPVAPCEDV